MLACKFKIKKTNYWDLYCDNTEYMGHFGENQHPLIMNLPITELDVSLSINFSALFSLGNVSLSNF